MRTVVIVLLDPMSDALLGMVEGLILVEPHLLFFQAAMKPFNVAVALGMVVSRAPMRDAQPIQRVDIPRRRKLRAVVGRQSQTRSTRTERQNLQHGAVERRQSFFGAAAQTQVPADDLTRATVDDRDQIRPAHTGPRPDLGHVRLPNVIGMRRFHLAPVLSARDPEAALAHQQPAFPHHAQCPFAIDHQPVLPPQPPDHATISIRRLLAAGQDDLLILRAIRTARARLPHG
jgi:hypothetical protein